MEITRIKDTTVAFYDGPAIAGEQDALDAMGACYGLDVDLLVLPVDRLAQDFFRLRTGLAGAVLQKFQNYGMRVAVLGGIDAWTSASQPLRDFVTESNRGRHVLFVADRAALEARL